MAEYKDNHIIPKCLLKNWNVQGQNFKGVHLFNLAKRKFQFSYGEGKHAFSFAKLPNFYVHQINGQRYTEIEELFSRWEDVLGRVAQKIIKNKKEAFLNDRNTFDTIFKAILSLKFRTKAYINSLTTYLEQNSEVKHIIEIDNTKDTKLIALESAINSLNEEFLSFNNCELIIHYDKKGELIIGDEPIIGLDYIIRSGQAKFFDEYSTLAISPNHLLQFKKSSKKTVFKFTEIVDETKYLYNNVIAEQSRYWIVANNQSFIEKYLSTFGCDKPPLAFALSEANFIKEYFKINTLDIPS